MHKKDSPFLRQMKRRVKEILSNKQEIIGDDLFLLIWKLDNDYVYSIKVVDYAELLDNDRIPFGKKLLIPAWEFVEMFGIEWNNLILEKLEEIKQSKYDESLKYLNLIYPIQLKDVY